MIKLHRKAKAFALVSAIFFTFTLPLFAQKISRLDGSRITSQELDARIDQLIHSAKIEGIAVTVINNSQPIYEKTFGYRNSETKEKLRGDTNFYGASLSKAVFSLLMMKLVEQGKLTLDKPLTQYLSKPIYEYAGTNKWTEDYSDLKGDTLHQQITARMCLSHTAGFHNWRFFEPDEKLHIHFVPGTRFSYSGEGFSFLQFVIEKKLGKSLEELVNENIFIPLRMTRSSYTWQPEFETNYCVGHDKNGKTYKKDKDNFARAGSTLETTADDYSTFLEAVLQNRIINSSSTKQMFTPVIRIRTATQFPPLNSTTTTANDAVQLSYGIGWGLLKTPYGTAAFKEGHGDGFQHYSVLFPKKKIGILILTNSDNGESIFKELLEYAIGDHYTPWRWENYIPYNSNATND
jgi:CubicO group peptidase (beta-lactamase class C family)